MHLDFMQVPFGSYLSLELPGMYLCFFLFFHFEMVFNPKHIWHRCGLSIENRGSLTFSQDELPVGPLGIPGRQGYSWCYLVTDIVTSLVHHCQTWGREELRSLAVPMICLGQCLGHLGLSENVGLIFPMK